MRPETGDLAAAEMVVQETARGLQSPPISPEPCKTGTRPKVGNRGEKRSRLTSSSSSSSSSSSDSLDSSDLDLSTSESFGKKVMKEVSRRCIRYVQGLEDRMKETVAALKHKKDTKTVGTQTEQDYLVSEGSARVSVFDRLN